jgi:hypothetical protein
MSPILEEVIERLRQMPPERQEAFARMILRELRADEQWLRSTALNAEWHEKQRVELERRSSQSIQKQTVRF